MSASQPTDRDVVVFVIKGNEKACQEAAIEAFEYNTNMQQNEISLVKTEPDAIKTSKRLCFIKTVIFPFEYCLYKLLLDKNVSSLRWELQKVYWGFLVNKLTYVEFMQKLVQLLSTSNNGAIGHL